MHRILYFFLPLLMLTSCFGSAGDAFRPDEPLAISAKVSAEASPQGQTKTNSVGGTLRMRRDEIIQLSLTKFGIEGVRILFAPDSLTIIDRMNHRYATTTYDQISQILGGKTLTFADIQAFFWNDRQLASESARVMVAALIPFQLDIERKGFTRIRDYRIAEQTKLRAAADGKGLDIALNLTKININYGWKANTKVPSGYQKMESEYLTQLLPVLIGKF